MENYIDTNYFMYKHLIETKDERMVSSILREFSLLKVVERSSWTSKVKFKHSHSPDGESDHLLFGAYFFMGNTVTLHKRDVFDFTGLISKVGGIYATLFAFFSAIGKYVNTNQFMGDLMKEMHYVSLKDND